MISFEALKLFKCYGSIAIFTQVFNLYEGNNLHAEKLRLPGTLYNMALVKLFGANVIRTFP